MSYTMDTRNKYTTKSRGSNFGKADSKNSRSDNNKRTACGCQRSAIAVFFSKSHNFPVSNVI